MRALAAIALLGGVISEAAFAAPAVVMTQGADHEQHQVELTRNITMMPGEFWAPPATLAVHGVRHLNLQVRKVYAWLWANKRTKPIFVPTGTPAVSTAWVPLKGMALTDGLIRDFSDLPAQGVRMFDLEFAQSLMKRSDAPQGSYTAVVPRYIDIRVMDGNEELGVVRVPVRWDCNAE